MSDHEALLAAICENPDEDTPRLVFADWLEERDQPERAAFVRSQVELARTPAWEPFAVLCKWRQTDWLTGNPFQNTLPPVDGYHVEWHPEAFRRGFGWRLNVRSLIAWEQLSPHVLTRAPVGEMHLWGATLDDWKRFVASPVVGQLRRLHFVASPNEPLRALREAPTARGITDLFFHRASGAGMPEVVEDLIASQMGQVLRGLHFRVGYESLDLLIVMLRTHRGLERLSFTTMGLTHGHIYLLSENGTLRNLSELHLRNEYSLGNEGVSLLARVLPQRLQDLTCSYVGIKADGIEALAAAEQLGSLRRLNLSQNAISPRAAKVLSASRSLGSLRSLILNKCRLGDKGVRHLTRSKFWRNLVELDLRDNPIARAGVGHLLDAPLPPDLTALIVDYAQIGIESQRELRKKYGERLVLSSNTDP
jgi:uncharacterized protein (TIGR02996 family)